MKISKGTRLFILGALLVVIDQIIKVLVKTDMSLGETINVLGDWFKLHYVLNEGMAFGMAFGGFLAIAVLRSYLPDFATKELHFPTSSQGIMLALVSIVQALVALCCCKAKRFPFKPWAGLFTGVCACAALTMLSL